MSCAPVYRGGVAIASGSWGGTSWGEMTTLVLLPGLDGTGELFAAFVAALRGHDVQIVDYPRDRAMSYAALEEFVREKLPGEVDYFLLAESFSGPIAISVAASSPPHLRGLILCGSFAANPLPA